MLVVVEKGKKSLVDNRKHKCRTLYFKIDIILTYHGVKRISDIGSTRGHCVAIVYVLSPHEQPSEHTFENYWLLWRRRVSQHNTWINRNNDSLTLRFFQWPTRKGFARSVKANGVNLLFGKKLHENMNVLY
jgi:hypothetical protein